MKTYLFFDDFDGRCVSALPAALFAALVGPTDRLSLAGPHVVHQWRRRHEDFPQPLTVVSGVGVWSWPDVARWARATGRM